MSELATRPATRWPGYNTVWRWHFYAGLFCLPFVLWLAVTGSVYLFRPQIEALLDRPYARLADAVPAASAGAQARAAVRAVPGSVLHRYQLPGSPRQSVQIVVGRGRTETRVYVHPRTLVIMQRIDEDRRPMAIVFRLHGELLAGAAGSILVELAASWAIVMILSGLFLWWPRGGGMAGVVWPRLAMRGRPFWRDLHAVTGFWIALSALALLLSGLPWATSWGAYLKTIRAVATGQAAGQPVRQDWASGRGDELRARASADAGTRAMMGEHVEHGGMAMAHPPASYVPLDRLIATVGPLALAPPVLIAPPTGPGQPWTAKSDAADRPRRVNLTLDGVTGRILSRRAFADRPLIDRIVGYGVAAHEGQLFGWINQLLSLVTAIGLATVTVSGAVMWWRRRPAGRLGAPPTGAAANGGVARPAPGFALLLIALGLVLPLMGLSMVAMLLTERTVLRRLPASRRWLGLAPVPSARPPQADGPRR